MVTKTGVLLSIMDPLKDEHCRAGSPAVDIYKQDLQHLNYWECLEELKLFSKKDMRTTSDLWLKDPRRTCTWHGAENKQWPEKRTTLLHEENSDHLPKKSSNKTQLLPTNNEACLFSLVPKAIRGLTGITTDSFKCQLEWWLATVLDEPLTPGPGYLGSTSNYLAT